MKVKRELIKFLVSSLLMIFHLVYLDSDRFRNSIFNGFKNIYDGFFFDIKYILIFLLFLLVSYAIFNIFYFIFYIILKTTDKKINNIILTSSVLLILLLLSITNDQLIFNDLKEYKNSNFFLPSIAEENEIDSTNFKNYTWQRKQYSASSPCYIITEKIIFNKDSTFTLTGNRIKFGKLYLFRKLFKNKIEYNITRPYTNENVTSSFSLFDSTTAYPLQIRFNRLYLNTNFIY